MRGAGCRVSSFALQLPCAAFGQLLHRLQANQRAKLRTTGGEYSFPLVGPKPIYEVGLVPQAVVDVPSISLIVIAPAAS